MRRYRSLININPSGYQEEELLITKDQNNFPCRQKSFFFIERLDEVEKGAVSVSSNQRG